MAASAQMPDKDGPTATKAGRTFYASDRVQVRLDRSGDVQLDIPINAHHRAQPRNIDPILEQMAQEALAQTPMISEDARHAIDSMIRKLDEEIDNIVSAYRDVLRGQAVEGTSPKLKEALNRARLQDRILRGTEMADQAQACELLGLSTANPSAAMKRAESRLGLLRFTLDGRAVYPLLQFDVDNRRIYPAIPELVAKTPDGWSPFRLLYWLTRPHRDFDVCPADALGSDPDAVLRAYDRETTPKLHG